MAKEAKVPVMYIEVVDRKPSGFIMSGTQGTAQEQQLMAPSVQWIDPRGKMAQMVTDPKTKVTTRHDVEIRFINGCDTIIPKEQKERGFEPNRFEDKIAIENGFATIERQGSTIGLYDYLEKVFYNKDAPGRPQTADARFQLVKLNEKAQAFADNDELETEAKQLVYSLRKKSGSKVESYLEDKIDTLCRLFGVWDDSNEKKIVVLLNIAKKDPAKFITVFEQAGQVIQVEITQALELDIIIFDGNVAMYKDGSNVIKSLGTEKMKPDEKIEALADWFGTNDGNPALTELRQHLEITKEKLLK